MDNIEIIVALIGMSIVMVVCRCLPLLMPANWLQMRWLQRLNQALPLCIMLILLLSSLNIPHNAEQVPHFLFEILSLATVIFSYHLWRNSLVSVVVGITSINILYGLF